MAGENGSDDMDDIAEEGSWICSNLCGAGGRCVKGDEQMMEALHLAQGCPNV
jgi:hypothetical protein